MKKAVIIAIAVVAVAALAFGVINFVQTGRLQAARNQASAQGWLAARPAMLAARNFTGAHGFMGQQDNFAFQGKSGRGMMGNFADNTRRQDMHLLREYHQAALAEKLGLTVEELDAQLQDGKTMLDLAAIKGMTVEEFKTLRDEVRILAIDKALEAGVISQNQADWMKENQPNGMRGFGNW